MNNNTQDMKIHQQQCEKMKPCNAVEPFDLVESCAKSMRSLLLMFRVNLFLLPSKGQDVWSQQLVHFRSVSD